MGNSNGGQFMEKFSHLSTPLKKKLRHILMIQVLIGAAIDAFALGFPKIARFLARMGAGESLIQIVIKGQEIRDVHGLPVELLEHASNGKPVDPYDLLDYDAREDLYRDRNGVARLYARAGVPMPDNFIEAYNRLDEVLQRLEWTGDTPPTNKVPTGANSNGG
jgi:hypothetical protein